MFLNTIPNGDERETVHAELMSCLWDSQRTTELKDINIFKYNTETPIAQKRPSGANFSIQKKKSPSIPAHLLPSVIRYALGRVWFPIWESECMLLDYIAHSPPGQDCD